MTGAPDSLVVRPARAGDVEALARVHAETWQDAYRHLMPPRALAQFSYARRLALWRGLLEGKRAPLVEVAETREGALVGLAWLRLITEPSAHYDGEIIALAVRPDQQGRGIGRRLMATAAERLAECGARNCYLWVYRANTPARGFYEALEGRIVDQDVETSDQLELPIVAYAWTPLSDLIAACRRQGAA